MRLPNATKTWIRWIFSYPQFAGASQDIDTKDECGHCWFLCGLKGAGQVEQRSNSASDEQKWDDVWLPVLDKTNYGIHGGEHIRSQEASRDS